MRACLTLGALLMLSPVTDAQQAGGAFELRAHVVQGGGELAQGGIELTNSLGDGRLETISAGDFVLQGGFWPAGAQTADKVFQNGFE